MTNFKISIDFESRFWEPRLRAISRVIDPSIFQKLVDCTHRHVAHIFLWIKLFMYKSVLPLDFMIEFLQTCIVRQWMILVATFLLLRWKKKPLLESCLICSYLLIHNKYHYTISCCSVEALNLHRSFQMFDPLRTPGQMYCQYYHRCYTFLDPCL